jgi:hypothetical protein
VPNSDHDSGGESNFIGEKTNEHEVEENMEIDSDKLTWRKRIEENGNIMLPIKRTAASGS